jgi:hypothetical protein
VRWTALGTRLAGSSSPRCCLQSKCVTSIAQRNEKEREDLSRVQAHIGAVENPRRSTADGILRKNKTQQPILARFVVQPGTCFHAKRTMQAVLVEVKRFPTRCVSFSQASALLSRSPFLYHGPRRFLVFGGWPAHRVPLGMNGTDQIKVIRQRRQHALAAVKAVDNQNELADRETKKPPRLSSPPSVRVVFCGVFCRF